MDSGARILWSADGPSTGVPQQCSQILYLRRGESSHADLCADSTHLRPAFVFAENVCWWLHVDSGSAMLAGWLGATAAGCASTMVPLARAPWSRVAWSSRVSERQVNECVLRRVGCGDTRVVQDCINRFRRLVWSLARRLYTSPSQAEDKMHEISRCANHWEMEARGI